MERRRFCYTEVLPFSVMLVVECTNVGTSTIFKAATLKGLSYNVFMPYSYAISALVLLPLCYIFHKNTKLPPFNFGHLARFFILGLLGFAAQYLGFKGIDYGSPTLASAMSNLTPASTFVLAVLFRMEMLDLKSLSSLAKITGTVISIAGAFVVVFYAGPAIISNKSSPASISAVAAVNPQSNWVMGGMLLAASYVLVALWYISQAKAVKDYPAEIVVAFFYSLFSFTVAAPICFIMEPNLSAWKLEADVRLLSVLYSGIIGSGLGTVVHTWGLQVRGPVYVALFSPVSIPIAAAMSVILLGDNLYLGCVMGAVAIALGFYVVIWGKSQEGTREKLEAASLDSSTQNVPLLKGCMDYTNKEPIKQVPSTSM